MEISNTCGSPGQTNQEHEVIPLLGYNQQYGEDNLFCVKFRDHFGKQQMYANCVKFFHKTTGRVVAPVDVPPNDGFCVETCEKFLLFLQRLDIRLIYVGYHIADWDKFPQSDLEF